MSCRAGNRALAPKSAGRLATLRRGGGTSINSTSAKKEGTPATDQNTRREIIHRCRAAVGALYELDIATNREHRRRKKVRGRLKIAPAIQARKLMLAGWLAGCLPADEAANGKSGHQKMTKVIGAGGSASGTSGHHQEKEEGEKKLIKHDLQGKVIAGDVVTGSSSSSSSRKRR
ncbi:hypothetical protein PPTG_22198 [Phytophthora nicotianae INRA-310]|uniref:Uncharacterized protein n=1 Tax=Phytophthora nicotianae (strain INRA-310) TaxID=761204 RepID=W2QLV1_PHYN3|nr:hypothetical protein PPTG_22198 [Phytophthora nicotianae INRA-310]ETN14118.1 hypothetical protein PPTG_22198 [Phytophthora nicotianae INRA-310]